MRRRVLLTWTLVWAGGALSACGGDSSAPAPSPPTPAPPSPAPPSPGAPPAPTPAGPPLPSSPAPGYALNFAAAAIENPLSAGGVWSNNTQGTGGNPPPLNMTSMCVGLAADGITRIAYPTHQGINYDDSFAFVPGFGADQWCEGVLYLAAGYNPTTSPANHEVEIILGCRTATGYHRWNEFMFNWGGGADIVSLDGGPGAYTVIGSITVATFTAPRDGDVLRATKVADTLNMYLNGVRIVTYTGPLVADGSGIGIAGFIRPGATHNKFGFRSVSMGNL